MPYPQRGSAMIFRHRKNQRNSGRPWYMLLAREEKDNGVPALFTHHLHDTITQPGCVMCRLVRESEEQWLWNLLYEYTGDPQIHARFADSLGLCGQHAELMRMIVEKRQLVTPSGVARLYDTVSREELLHLSRTDHRPETRKDDCPLCRYHDEVAERKASFLARALADNTWWKEYALSDGLCQGHLKVVLSQADRSIATMLRDDHAKRLRDLSHLLQELQRKQRYDVPEQLTHEEASSWREALWRFGGMSFDSLLLSD